MSRPAKPFDYYVDKSGACWIWIGTRNREGYGMLVRTVNGKQRATMAHRYSWIQANGPIPIDYTVDHLCRNTSCVNPAHLEAVPHRVNVLRGNNACAVNARKTHCPRGHLLEPHPRKGGRWCPICYRAQDADRHRRKRAAA